LTFAAFAPVRGIFVALAPVDGCLSSGYGARPGGRGAFHNGVDFATGRVPRPIYAAADGVVAEAQTRTGYGSQIVIDHGNGVETRYAHLSSYADGVKPGARVRRGEAIGMTGSTGVANGIHLHYEILVDRRTIDPLAILEEPLLAAGRASPSRAAR
jgi:murein DD-endopeptidase MepM/ murein hydrolase activator NlpD